jgi:hypothetical protein
MFACFDKMIVCFESNVNSVTAGDGTGKGIVGDIREEIKNGIIDGFTWLVKSFFDVTLPFIEWGCKFLIIGSVIVFFCSHDTKYLSSAIKWGLIFIIVCFLRSVI